jgi:hypothetical protein
MGANIGGIYGAQLLRADDRPRYRRGFSIASAIIAFGVACAVFRYVVGGDVKARRRERQRRQQEQHLEGESDTEGGRMRGRLSSEDVRGRGHGAAMMRVATADGIDGGGDGGDGGDVNGEITDGDTDETLVATASSYEKAKGDGETDEVRKSDVIVREREREDGELHVVDDATAYRSWLESEIGIAR